MRYAFIADVHANLEALRAVLDDIRSRKIKDVFFLGDAVGYGPDPNECVRILREESRVLLAGNHDHAVCGLTDVSFFNVYARKAVEWTRGVIEGEHMDYFASLPLMADLESMDATIVHSTPCSPELWHYLTSIRHAEENFDCFASQVCFIGHSHRPFIIGREPTGVPSIHVDEVPRKKGNRYIVNAGSVGQPRDGDPRSSYAIMDEEGFAVIRVTYDFGTTQKKMDDAGLPVPLIERLAVGM